MPKLHKKKPSKAKKEAHKLNEPMRDLVATIFKNLGFQPIRHERGD